MQPSTQPLGTSSHRQAVALVIGGGRTIGAAAATCLAGTGRRVVVADRDIGLAQAQVAQLAGEGHLAIAMDATNEQSVAEGFGKAEREVGPVSVLVSGVGGPVNRANARTFASFALDDWEATYALNARSAFLCVREMLRRRESAPVQDARIVLVASIGAHQYAHPLGPAYLSSKAAVVSLTRFAAMEAAASGMTVNAVAPGAIDTPSFRATLSRDAIDAIARGCPIPRLGTVEEVGAAIAWLCSPEAGYITGATLDINGGRFMAPA